jgi:hypothetical protein
VEYSHLAKGMEACLLPVLPVTRPFLTPQVLPLRLLTPERLRQHERVPSQLRTDSTQSYTLELNMPLSTHARRAT